MDFSSMWWSVRCLSERVNQSRHPLRLTSSHSLQVQLGTVYGVPFEDCETSLHPPTVLPSPLTSFQQYPGPHTLPSRRTRRYEPVVALHSPTTSTYSTESHPTPLRPTSVWDPVGRKVTVHTSPRWSLPLPPPSL